MNPETGSEMEEIAKYESLKMAVRQAENPQDIANAMEQAGIKFKFADPKNDNIYRETQTPQEALTGLKEWASSPNTLDTKVAEGSELGQKEKLENEILNMVREKLGLLEAGKKK